MDVPSTVIALKVKTILSGGDKVNQKRISRENRQSEKIMKKEHKCRELKVW